MGVGDNANGFHLLAMHCSAVLQGYGTLRIALQRVVQQHDLVLPCDTATPPYLAFVHSTLSPQQQLIMLQLPLQL